MKINVKSINENIGDSFHTELSPEIEAKKINGQLIQFPQALEIDLEVINADQEYALFGTINLTAEQPCSRCLKTVTTPLAVEFSVEVDKAELEGDIIDISEYVIEQIRLAMPMQIVCDEDCQGLCPSCGINLNQQDCDCMMHKVDPRLAKLEKLLDK